MFYEDVLNNEEFTIGDKIETDFRNNEFRIVTEQARYPLSNLDDIFKDQILNPDYQRGRVWDDSRKSRLIESFLINIPVPPIFLYEIEYSKYEVMDGQQRVSTVLSFFKNEFCLKNLEFFKEFEGKFYEELPENIKNSIKRRYLSATILLKETARDKDEEVLMKQLVFERLNTGGMELTKQEIRNALYSSEFNKLLFELADNIKFKKLWRLRKEDRQRMEDCELILRFFAYKSAVTHNISKPIYEILDTYMQRAVNFTNEEIDILRELFCKTIDTVYDIFGESAFKSEENKNKREKMVYDTVMLFVSSKIEKENTGIFKKGDANSKKYEIIQENSDMFNGKYTAISIVKERVSIMDKAFS